MPEPRRVPQTAFLNRSVSGRMLALATASVLLAGFLSWLGWLRSRQLVTLERRIPSIMGTETTLKAVVPAGNDALGHHALRTAEAALRDVEAAMSTWMGHTEISRFNQAPPGQVVPLSAPTLAVLAAALNLARQTGGAFDATCRPLLETWRTAESQQRQPTAAELAAALQQVGSHYVRLHPTGAEKLQEGLGVDLGGLAKGYAVDRAIEAMRQLGTPGGLVQCGGDLRVFGPTPHGGPWRIAIESPVTPPPQNLPGPIELRSGAVSTSGTSRRGYSIQGRRRSHILDPRTGQPVEDVSQVTVIASNALLSDGWSTALTVLGTNGLNCLPPHVQALLMVGPSNALQLVSTPAFPR